MLAYVQFSSDIMMSEASEVAGRRLSETVSFYSVKSTVESVISSGRLDLVPGIYIW